MLKTCLLVASLVGCGVAPFEAQAICTAGQFTFKLEVQRDCENYEGLSSRATALLSDHGFPVAQTDLEIWVHKEQRSFLCETSGAQVEGCYHAGFGFIETEASAGSLSHELLHHSEFLEHLNNPTHAGWGSKGSNLSGTPYTLNGENDEIYPGSWRDITQHFIYDEDAAFSRRYNL